MVVMSTGGTPITIQNGSSLQQTAANATQVEKQQQQHQIQYQQLQKQQILQQQILQQQFAQIQQQQPQQFQLQVSPVTTQSILAQQQQLQNHMLQQQQQHHLQQRDQPHNVIHQVFLQQSPQQQQLQNPLNTSSSQQPQHQNVTSVPISLSSTSVTSISSGCTVQGQQIVYQSKNNSIPTTSVTISSQSGPVVTSTVGVSQVNANAGQQQSAQSSLPGTSQDPILAMASMMNAASNLVNSQNNSSVSSSTAQPQSLSSPLTSVTSSAIPSMQATPTKPGPVELQQSIQQKNSSSTLSAPIVSISSLEPGTRIIPLSIASSSANALVSTTHISTSVASQQTEVKASNAKVKLTAVEEQRSDAISGIKNMGLVNQNSSLSQTTEENANTTHQHQTSCASKPTCANTTVASSPHKTPYDASRMPTEASNVTLSVEKLQTQTPVQPETDQTTSITNKTLATAIATLSTTATVSKNIAAGANTKTEKTDLPKAMIKPNVLTHVIDDFIIQEASEPFPVTRSRYTEKDIVDEPPKKKSALEDISSIAVLALPTDMVACENCGKAEHKTKLKKKRFCSPTCARLFKTVGSELQAETSESLEANGSPLTRIANELSNVEVEKTKTDASSASSTINSLSNQQQVLTASAPTLPTESVTLPTVPPAFGGATASGEVSEMMNWTVTEVCEFIKSLPGCSDYVDDFEQQEIDGQALLLLKENHLVNAMNMKLGPALKIVAKVESMKDTSHFSSIANSTEKETMQ